MEQQNQNIQDKDEEKNEANDFIINVQTEEINQNEKYSLNQILENPSCLLSKEKVYLWKNSLFSEKLFNILTSEDNKIINRYKQIYNQIENILMGDFCDATEKIIYYKEFFYISFILNIKNDLNIDYLLFVIYYSKQDKSSEYFLEFLEFLNISEEKSDLKKFVLDFKNEHQYNNSELEYDKQCLLDSNVFFYKICKNNEDKIIRYPNDFEIINKSDKVKNIQMMDLKFEDKGFIDIDQLIPKSTIITNVLNIIRKKEILDYDLLFNQDIMNFTPSKTEKKLINKNTNFILSGRPGTGKTFIILIKTVLTYLNCWKEHSLQEIGLIDWEYLKTKYLLKNKDNYFQNDNYKIVVTSLSQVLCLKAEELFSQCMRSLDYNKEYNPTTFNEIEKMDNFQNIRKFPLFANFRKIIFLIDGSLNFQFFDRPANNKMNKRDNDCDIKYIPNLIYDINYKVDLNDIGVLNYFYRSKYGQTYKAKEINEDIFYYYFNEEISKNKILNNRAKRIAITTYEVYSQIISIIKGSYCSYLSCSNSLTREQYKVLGKKITMFTEEQKDEIYNYYIKYEKWKLENNYFDFQDVVNYLIRQVSIELVPKNIKLIDILFIDEVQDFSINQLYLMSLISRDIKVLAGDTCQTISKTNAFRFCDLNSIYYIAKEINNIVKNKTAVDIKEPEEIQTNLNFRCHYPVLKLAHLIFEMIFLLFPQTLDKVKCDFTKDITGYQPSIITDLDSFIKKLTGESNDKNNKDKNNNKKEFTFAFNHCFICRNMEAEKNLVKKYNKKILASTVTESKGMEYEIVIIYNFFKDAYPFVLNLWSKVLTHTKFEKTENQYIQNIQKELEYEEIDINLKNEIYSNFKDKITPTFTEVLDDELRHKLFNMCSELKELYVAITRAKTSLFFYDEEQNIYPLFIKILKKFNIINKEENQAIQYAIDYLSEHLLEENELKNIAEDNFKIGNYKKAEFYFNILKDEKNAKKSLIFLKFEEIQKMKNINKNSTEFKNLNLELLDLYKKYNISLEEYDILGDIYINLEMYDDALKFFKSKKNKKKCGLIYQSIGKFREAFNSFQDIKEHGLAIECLISEKDYNKLFNYIISNQNVFNLEHFLDYYKKYSNYYIENLKINFSQNKKINFISSNNNKPNDIIYIRKDVKIDKFKSIFDDKIITTKNPLTNDLLSTFPKLYKYSENQTYFGLNLYKEKHFFDQPSKQEKIEYLVSNKVSYNIFQKSKFNNISKNENEIIDVFDKYVKLFQFFFDFMSFKKNNLDESTINYINEQRDNIKRLKNIKYEFQNDTDDDKIKQEIKEKLNSLLITKITNQSLIYKAIKNWKLSKISLDIIDTQLLKTNIVPYFIKNFPLLIMHKTNDLEKINNSKSDKKELLNETLKEIVNICKQLPLKDEELIKCLESSMILSGHFKSILPFLSSKNLFLFAAMFKKFKIFIKLLIEQNISFIPTNLKKGYFSKDDNFFFIFNSFISLNLCKYFNYRAKSQIDKAYKKSIDMYNQIIVERLEYLKEYPKLYSLLYKFESSFQLLDKLMNTKLKKLYVPFPISHYIGVFAKFLSQNNKEYSDKELIDLIEIGNTISLYITINGLTSTSCSNNDIKSNSENMYKIARFLIKLKELLLVYENINYKYLITVFSLFSALGITLIPQTKELEIFNTFPCAILNNSSILIWSNEKYFNYLNIIYKMSLFDSSAKNRLIFYNNIYDVFNEITHRAITKVFINQNPFQYMPVYNFLDISNIKPYFDSLLYNYSLHRRKYLNEICSLNINKNKEEKLINELNIILNVPKAYYTIYNFGLYEDFCSTLCNWPGEDSDFNTIDIMFFPFYRWEQRIKNDAILNFTQIAIILGELPMPFETLLSLDNEEYKKSMNLIFDINENLFNDIFYLYNKVNVNENKTIYCDTHKNFKQTHGKKEIERIFINFILFSLLINKYSGYKYSEFYKQSFKNIIVEELFKLIGYDKNKFEKEQQIFPYKLILHIFKNYNKNITKLLKLIWIKKLYPFVLYSLKKSNSNINDDIIHIFGINEETIDFRYFNYYNIKLTDEEISLYFTILDIFIKDELYKTKNENIFNDRLLEKSNKHFPRGYEYRKYLYRGYLQNYIELQIRLIILSLKNIYLLEMTKVFSKNIEEILKNYKEKSFYERKIIKEIEPFPEDKKFMFYTFNEKNKLVENHINIIKLSIREINVNSKYEPRKVVFKEVMNKNLLNRRFLFINNHKEENDKDDIKYRNELINFLFVPLHKETLPQYLQTAQKIYNDYWS